MIRTTVVTLHFYCSSCQYLLFNRLSHAMRPWRAPVCIVCPKCHATLQTSPEFRAGRWSIWLWVCYLLLAFGLFDLIEDTEQFVTLGSLFFLLTYFLSAKGSAFLERHRSHPRLVTAKLLLWGWLLTDAALVVMGRIRTVFPHIW